ncbi:MAG TPA: cytochrome c maturation protein CcmE [Solirubrobacteraceae bacterium]|nr:cytochrome c maturation protein CcmE [Solirubrobacteraceae bacterium]
MSSKRRRRFVVALTVAVVLAAALVYTSVSASSEAITPGHLLAAAVPGQSYQLTGRVLPGYVHRGADELDFRVADRAGGGASVPVRYSGEVPDPFRAGREVIVTVRRSGTGFVGERDSLVTKCPSKFQDKPA